MRTFSITTDLLCVFNNIAHSPKIVILHTETGWAVCTLLCILPIIKADGDGLRPSQNMVYMAAKPAYEVSGLKEIVGALEENGRPSGAAQSAISESLAILYGLQAYSDHVPDCDAFSVNSGLEIVWQLGPKHVHLFCGQEEQDSYLYYALEEENDGLDSEIIKPPTSRRLAERLSWMES